MPAPQPSTGQGQWALGHREPLNANERSRRTTTGSTSGSGSRTSTPSAASTPSSPSDLRGRMRWWGLYTQRRPGIDGGQDRLPRARGARRQVLHAAGAHRRRPAHLPSSCGRSATSAREYARDTADVTDRQNIQLHWIRIEDVPAIWQRLEAVGLSTTEACGDTPRVILGSPLAGDRRGRDHRRHPGDAGGRATSRRHRRSSPTCRASSRRRSRAAPTTAPFTRSTTSPSSASSVPTPPPASTFGSAAGCRPTPSSAVRLGVFVTPEQVPDVWAGVTSIFRDYGYRRSRTRARLKFLVADWGPERFREVLEKEYLGYSLPDGPAPRVAACPAPRPRGRDPAA